MKRGRSNYRWFVVVIFFIFMLLHQTDRLMIGPMQDTIEKQFAINDQQWGLINSGALLVGTVLYPIWGFLYDRYAACQAAVPRFRDLGRDHLDQRHRSNLPHVPRYPGHHRHRRFRLSGPLFARCGLFRSGLARPDLRPAAARPAHRVSLRHGHGADDRALIGGWRQAFYITGSLGLAVAALIYFGVKELPRGRAEPEFENVEEMGQFHFSWKEALEIFRKKTMWFVFLQGFAGIFPWNVITFFFFGYLMADRGYSNDEVLLTMAPVILVLAGGYFLGGFLGDWMFKRTNKGRILVSCVGVILGAIFLTLALKTPVADQTTFFIWMALTAIFMPLSSPNVVATVYDVTVPEVRSTANAVEYFMENIGAAFAPILAGFLSVHYGKGNAILWVCVVAWLMCFLFYLGALLTVDKDIHDLRSNMAERALGQTSD